MLNENNAQFNVNLTHFSGSLEVLLDLAKSQKVNLENISITKLNFPKDGYITVNENQTIYEIANTFNILPQEIVRANNLKAPYELSKGQQIFLPYPLMHKVKKLSLIHI